MPIHPPLNISPSSHTQLHAHIHLDSFEGDLLYLIKCCVIANITVFYRQRETDRMRSISSSKVEEEDSWRR